MDYNTPNDTSNQENTQSLEDYIGGERIIETRCQKLLSHNWMNDMPVAPGTKPCDMIEVRFKNSHKEFFHCPPEISDIKEGDVVAVEATAGHDIGIVSLTGEVVNWQYNRKEAHKRTHEELKKVYRKARLSDIEKWIVSIDREHETLIETRKIVEDLKLNMKLNDVEYQGDNTKAIFYYTADDRVDFRELIKILAERFRIRIEMKQIGIRQEAARMGGLGSCGRELCCSSWTSVFQSVSTQTARTQQLPLNPQKLAGQCCKLKCCLNYEQDVYVDSTRYFPSSNVLLRSKEGNAHFVKLDAFKKLMWYAYNNSNNNQLMVFELNKVWEIIKMNEKNILPDKLEDVAYKKEANTGGFANMQNQDDLNRFDKTKNRSNDNRSNNNGNRQNGNNRPNGNHSNGNGYRQNGNGNRPNGSDNTNRQNDNARNSRPQNGNNNRQGSFNQPRKDAENNRNQEKPTNEQPKE